MANQTTENTKYTKVVCKNELTRQGKKMMYANKVKNNEQDTRPHK